MSKEPERSYRIKTDHEAQQTEVYDLNESKIVAHTMESMLDRSVESIEDQPKPIDKKSTIRSLRRDAINQRRRSSRLSAIAGVTGGSGHAAVSKVTQRYHELQARYSYSLETTKEHEHFRIYTEQAV